MPASGTFPITAVIVGTVPPPCAGTLSTPRRTIYKIHLIPWYTSGFE